MTSHSWNSNKLNSRTYRVHGKWVNWLDQSGWRPISPGFTEDSGRYTCSQIPGVYSVPAVATGAVTLSVDNRWDVFNKQAINEPAMVLEITPENVSPVSAVRDDNQPDRITYPNAFADGVDLRYTVWHGRGPRVTREVVIRQEPPGDHDLQGSWLIRGNARAYVEQGGQYVRPWAGNVAETAVVQGFGVTLRSGTSLDNESLIRGCGLKTPYAWYYKPDGELVRTPIAVRFEIVTTDTVRATKTIPRLFIREAFAAGATSVMADDTSTFYPDPHAETTSVDGYCYESTAQTWSSLRGDVGSSHNDTSSPLIVAVYSAATTDQFYNMHRSLCLFDTSSLTGQTVSSATFGATYYTHTATHTETAAVALVGSTPASNTDLVNGDYAQLGSTRYCDTDIADTAWSGTMTWAMNAAGISAIDVEGITKLGLLLAFDLDDSAPSWVASGKQSNLQVRSAENTGTASDPYLEVTHAVASSGIGKLINGGLIRA